MAEQARVREKARLFYGFDGDGYMHEKEMEIKHLPPAEIQQLFTDECIKWKKDAQERAITGRRQNYIDNEVERLSRDLYKKLLSRRGDPQQVRQLHRERVETQENQRLRDYEEQHQRQDFYDRKYIRRDE